MGGPGARGSSGGFAAGVTSPRRGTGPATVPASAPGARHIPEPSPAAVILQQLENAELAEKKGKKKKQVSGENAQRHVAGTKQGRVTPGDAGAGTLSACCEPILRIPAHPRCLLRGAASCRSLHQQRLNVSSSRIFPSVRIWG